ncbi:MAG: hypothetical protein HZA54_10250 [Planctomycetes bacterium]|nr:hypothetical protein [Planctomycetota bacterium]
MSMDSTATLQDRLLAWLRTTGCAGPAREFTALGRELDAFERERAELRGRIPLWDRVIFFSDTPDEARAKEVERELTAARRRRSAVERELADLLAAAEKTYPPLALARRIETALALAAAVLRAPGDSRGRARLAAGLHALGDQVLADYAPDFSARRFEAQLSDLETCRVAAAGAAAVARGAAEPAAGPVLDLERGYAPMRQADLLPLVARRLLDGPLFERLAGRAEWAQVCNRFLDDLRRAEAQIPWYDRLNPLSDSPAEQERDRLEQELARTEAEWSARVERARAAFLEALGAFPPLGLYVRIAEAGALAEALAPGTERVLDGRGRLVNASVATPGALLLAALSGVAAHFRAAFALELPGRLVAILAGEGASPGNAEPELRRLAPLVARLDAGAAPGLRDRALEHARVSGAIRRCRQEGGGSEAGARSRLLSWVPALTGRDREAQARAELHAERTRRLWSDLVTEVERAAEGVPALFLREQTVRLRSLVAQVDTYTEVFDRPVACSVFHREALLTTLQRIRQTLEEAYGLAGVEDRLMAAVAAAAPAPAEIRGDEVYGVRPLSPAALHGFLAHRLEDTAFATVFRRLEAAEAERLRAEDGAEQAAARVSLWDRLNVFSDTDDERTERAERGRAAALTREIRDAVRKVKTWFPAACRVYPPIELYYRLPEVVAAVSGLRAECTGSRFSLVPAGGDSLGSRRTERWRCRLIGKAAAVRAVADWSARFAAAFGPMPSRHRILELWAEGGAGLGGL